MAGERSRQGLDVLYPDSGSVCCEAIEREDAGSLPVPEFHRTPILFLEDSLETAHVFESFLRNSEFQPILASTVAQAEVWCARHTPSAVLADVYISDEPSWGFIGRREELPDLPLIVTSACDERKDTATVAKGANLFLIKPLDPRSPIT